MQKQRYAFLRCVVEVKWEVDWNPEILITHFTHRNGEFLKVMSNRMQIKCPLPQLIGQHCHLM